MYTMILYILPLLGIIFVGTLCFYLLRQKVNEYNHKFSSMFTLLSAITDEITKLKMQSGGSFPSVPVEKVGDEDEDEVQQLEYIADDEESDESDEDYYEQTHITPEKAEMEVGDVYAKEVENVEFGRIETQAARQVILQKVREAEKALIISQFKPNNNKLVSGVVKRVTRDNFILDLGQDAEAILPRDSILPGEIFSGENDILSKPFSPSMVRFFMMQAHYTSIFYLRPCLLLRM